MLISGESEGGFYSIKKRFMRRLQHRLHKAFSFIVHAAIMLSANAGAHGILSIQIHQR